MYTIVGKNTREAIMNRPDWPELEKKMKAIYGDDWMLVTHEEAATKAKPDNPSR